MASAQEHWITRFSIHGRPCTESWEKRAGLSSDAIYLGYPVSALNFDDDYRKITCSDFKNAVNGAARGLQRTLGPG